ncbi:OLC1v1003413C1 [Oldenlandia corymbosa var. corymbosa]|uniref:OLC1v1003413C1 n=1 Tax=Oldenlandia corymbosa var. corymbosa TaxID=529605 RepID=A0AAV1D9Z9_OLDCO|nr:OLC1v1003413C1 [Oldenlandia corymbosa var. corymbosa]
MSGAIASSQGDCTSFNFRKPHCCKATPEIVDLMPDAMLQNMSLGLDCCRSGFLAAWAIDPSNSLSSFEMTVGNLDGNSSSGYSRPVNLTLLAPGPGYTCSPVEDTDPTISSVIGGRREEQVYRTWKSTCTYSSFLAKSTRICCVSLSTFYNPQITSCPSCSCGCKEADQSRKQCISEGTSPSSPSDLVSDADIVRCTDHMCPLQIHWHVKQNYIDHWRVKLTISNFNLGRSYANWNVLVQHPGFSQSITTYSFNSTILSTSNVPDEVALFWGISYYNDQLWKADENRIGSATTDILLRKDKNSFTLRNGWAFPRRIYFNGESCDMPLPDTFPSLPNGVSRTQKDPNIVVLILFYLTYKILS